MSKTPEQDVRWISDRERLEAIATAADLALADEMRDRLAALGHHHMASRRALLLDLCINVIAHSKPALTPAQAEPVARLYTKQGHLPRLAFSVQPEAREADWTETPLYAAPQPAPVAERAAIVAYLRQGHQAYTGHNMVTFGEAYSEAADAIEQGLHHRAQALADLAEGDADLIGGGA